MTSENTVKVKKISGILSPIFLFLTLALEIFRQMTQNGIIVVFRTVFFVFFAVSFTVFLFLVFKKRFGKLKAVFYTLYSDCILGFLVGVLITLLAGAQDPTVFGMTPIASIYYYFIGLLVMTISVALVFVGMLTYAILSGIHERKLKKHQRCG